MRRKITVLSLLVVLILIGGAIYFYNAFTVKVTSSDVPVSISIGLNN